MRAPEPLKTRLRLRILLGPDAMLGPGKADLLDLIDQTGSIAAAGRRMGMSYKRAWSLVDTMNAMFAAPLVESSRGGKHGGGARLTDTGVAVLTAYRRAESRATEACADDVAMLTSLLGDMSDGK